MSSGNGFVEHTLDNGLRVVIEPMSNVRSAAAGFLVRTGARDESPELAGVSHFLEHMCFKGTDRRDWRQITVDFDRLGSTYNAFTSKERTFYFGWVREQDLERQIELLADMMRSVLPTAEFDMEKKVILEEIAMSNDQIDRCAYDFIHEELYAGHSLAWPVLGTAEHIEALTRDQLSAYFESRYHAGNIVLIIAGRVDPDQALDVAKRLCGDWPAGSPRPDRAGPPPLRTGAALRRIERFQQQAVAVTLPAPGAAHEDRDTANVLASILGGANSRFFWNIIQKGVAPYVSAGRLDYCDHGLMVLCGFAEPDKIERVVDAMRTEARKITDEGVSDDEVQRVKNRARTGLASESESPYHRLTQILGDVDVLGGPRTVSQRLDSLDAVTPGKIAEYLDRWPIREGGFLASVGPREWPEL